MKKIMMKTYSEPFFFPTKYCQKTAAREIENCLFKVAKQHRETWHQQYRLSYFWDDEVITRREKYRYLVSTNSS